MQNGGWKRDDPRGKNKRSTSTPPLEEVITEDGILCNIISSLPLREGIRTCVLSSRWRHLWTHLPRLHFNAANILDSHTPRPINCNCYYYGHYGHHERHRFCLQKRELLDSKTEHFIQFVDSVLQQYHGRVDEIVVEYFLHKGHSHHLDAWVRFATSKARRLVLYLEQPYFKKEIEPYDFPCQLLGSFSSIEELSLVACSLKLPCKFDGFRLLKVLSLHDVDITSEDINLLLSSCWALEKLDVLMSKELVSLTIPDTLCQLHYLSVKECDQLRKINIHTANLITLRYKGVIFDFRHIPSSQLKDIDICFKAEDSKPMPNLSCFLTKLSIYLPHLESLTLSISGFPQVDNLPIVSNSFIHLTRLDWKWKDTYKMSVLHLATLLDAAPFLEELKLRLSTRVAEPPPSLGLQKLKKLKKKLPNHPHSGLKIIEISGFSFDMWQFEVVLYLIKNAAQLKSITIKRHRYYGWDIHGGVRELINILSIQVPSNVKFEFVVYPRD